jgi:LytR cell envelope-related transcriptional attenuator
MRTGRGTPGPGREGGIHTAKAVAVIAVLAVIGVVVLAKSTTSGSKSASATTTKTTVSTPPTTALTPVTTVPLIPPARVKVQVLNGVGTGSYAGEWSQKLKTTYGYDTLPPDNATATVASSVIYIVTAGYEPEAKALATDVGLADSAIDLTVPPPQSAPLTVTARTQTNLVLVVGPDLTGTA